MHDFLWLLMLVNEFLYQFSKIRQHIRFAETQTIPEFLNYELRIGISAVF
ncbi:hypothetical protein NIES4103_61160 [Nostoc sp. NIES-4103]|nr:hypothetical protein NIES4103_61160 [Nostoc sp. NIES-4103]